MEIAKHLELHENALRALAHRYAGIDRDARDDCYQAGALALIEAHAGAFRHESELLTYAHARVREYMAKQVSQAEPTYGITEDLEELQELAEDRGNDKLSLEPLYGETLPGLKSTEQGLGNEDQRLVEEIKAQLTPWDWQILEASFGRSQRLAAETLGMSLGTYQRRLAAIEKKTHFHQELLSDAS